MIVYVEKFGAAVGLTLFCTSWCCADVNCVTVRVKRTRMLTKRRARVALLLSSQRVLPSTGDENARILH